MTLTAARAFIRALAAVVSLALLAACGASKSGGQPSGTTTVTATPTASTPAATASTAVASSPPIVAVTASGALVLLDPASGVVTRSLVRSGVVGDEVSVAPNGTVYFTSQVGCTDEIESVAETGGTPVVLVPGRLPAVSPDGTKLAYASEPAPATACTPKTTNLVPLYKLVVRTLSTGASTSYPMVPAGQGSGLPAPVFHLSWAPDNVRLAVSISSIEDNEGWNLVIVNTHSAKYYLTGAGATNVPVTGLPSQADSYLREGVFLPDGDLFISRACCAGVPERNTSRLLWEVSPAGVLVHQVAIGYPTIDHISLDASANGRWLLYLAGQELYVSHNGATPAEVTTGLIAAAWI